MSEPEASEEDKVIATVVLAGWTIEKRDGSLGLLSQYRVDDDKGQLICFRATRYTAALYALSVMRVRGLLP